MPVTLFDQVTASAQDCPGSRSNGGVGQPLAAAAASVNEPAATRTALTCSTALPALCSVKVCTSDVTFAGTMKLSAPGTTLTAGWACALPLPLTATSGGFVPDDSN